ncbi:MAG: zinc ribbon domain-containing protein [Herpetosiphonaceae bacterium]|nr:zinc ribbon domain-containing protein [Herpetosiphonaceae bacterium]
MENILAELKNILPIVGLLISSYVVVLWVAALIWTYRDIHSRTEDILIQVLSVAIVFVLNFAGLIVYLILRPRETLIQKYERELEETYMRRDIEDEHVCPTCQRGIQPDFILCPYCQTSLRRACGGCERVVDLTWQVCPYCATPAGGGSSRTSQPIYRQQEEVLVR